MSYHNQAGLVYPTRLGDRRGLFERGVDRLKWGSARDHVVGTTENSVALERLILMLKNPTDRSCEQVRSTRKMVGLEDSWPVRRDAMTLVRFSGQSFTEGRRLFVKLLG